MHGAAQRRLRRPAADARHHPHALLPHTPLNALQLGGTDRIPPGGTPFLHKERVVRRRESGA